MGFGARRSGLYLAIQFASALPDELKLGMGVAELEREILALSRQFASFLEKGE